MNETTEAPLSAPVQSRRIVVDIGNIDVNPYQPRRTRDLTHIASLAESIEQFGLTDAPSVRLHPENPKRYQLIDGQNRTDAVLCLVNDRKHAGEIEVVVKEATDIQMLQLTMTQNMKRKQFGAIDKAWGFAKLEKMGMSQDEIGAQYEYSQPAISNFVRLLGLDDIVKAWINDETLSAGHGTALLSLPKEHQLSWAERAVKESIAVKPLEDQIRKWKAEEKRRLNPPIPDTADENTTNPPAKDAKPDVTDEELAYVKGEADSPEKAENETDADAVADEAEADEAPVAAPPASATFAEVSGPPVVAMVPATESAWLKSVGLTAGVGLAHLRRFYGICQAAPNLGRVLELDGLGGALDYLEKMHEPISVEDEGDDDTDMTEEELDYMIEKKQGDDA